MPVMRSFIDSSIGMSAVTVSRVRPSLTEEHPEIRERDQARAARHIQRSLEASEKRREERRKKGW